MKWSQMVVRTTEQGRLPRSFNSILGLLVYYEFRGQDDKSNGGPGLKAFPPGFRMTSGNPVLRSKKSVSCTKVQNYDSISTGTLKAKAPRRSSLNVLFNGLVFVIQLVHLTTTGESFTSLRPFFMFLTLVSQAWFSTHGLRI